MANGLVKGDDSEEFADAQCYGCPPAVGWQAVGTAGWSRGVENSLARSGTSLGWLMRTVPWRAERCGGVKHGQRPP
ncbi:hypothetical protein GCM10012286_20460 [Streptomyces lasiicapitis]|uniref:Uncharacterized protein n=1 Tax=Streptomyces lasiicapitis TaxID=1923961 RepID=A0ABQ2LNN3_9ACTN|nr:hypothetical protein GCM10012286_20460 [Streptomyces lasiicapitis]